MSNIGVNTNLTAGKRLKEAREKRGFTQTQVANYLGAELFQRKLQADQKYSLRQYQKLEAGNFPKNKKDIVEVLDGLFDTNLYELIYGTKGRINSTAPAPMESTLTNSPPRSGHDKANFQQKYYDLLEKYSSNSDEMREQIKFFARVQSASVELLLSLSDDNRSHEILKKYDLEDIFQTKDR